MLIDTHAHLFWDSFKEDYPGVLQRAAEAGINTIINVAVDLNTSDIVTKLKSENEKIQFFCSVAIHPEEVIHYSSDEDVSIRRDIDGLGELISGNKSNPTRIVAVGECGLDYYFAYKPWTPPPPTTDPGKADSNLESAHLPVDKMTPDRIKTLQIKLLRAHIELAKKHNLPLLIHCRDDRSLDPQNAEAWNKVIEMTKDHFGIYHCYSGLPQTTNRILNETKFLISFAGNITYPKNDYLLEAVKLIPLNRIALETDCPFLAPQVKRGERNEPANVVEAAKTIAEVKGISLEEVVNQTSENVKRLLRI